MSSMLEIDVIRHYKTTGITADYRSHHCKTFFRLKYNIQYVLHNIIGLIALAPAGNW